MGPNRSPQLTGDLPQPKPKSSLTAPVRRASQLREIIENSLGLVIVLVLLIAFFSFQTAHFFSATTFAAIANEIPTAIFIAIGMTFVLIIGGIDRRNQSDGRPGVGDQLTVRVLVIAVLEPV